MGAVRDTLQGAVRFITQEILPVRHELVKAGLLSPQENRGYEPKSNLADPYSFNYMSYGYKERFSLLDYAKLRQISYADPIVSAILQTRVNQVAAYSVPQVNKYKVGFKIGLRDDKAHETKGSRKHTHNIEKFMMNSGFPESFEDTTERRKRDNFEQFLRKITRDSLTFDQINFEVVPRRNGLPSEFVAVDAGTIRLVADKKDMHDVFYNRDQNPINYADVMPREQTPTDRPTKAARLVQVIRGTIITSYDEWEMAFGIRNPRTDILANGYGFSEIEMLLATIAAHINAETYNRKFFSQGSAIKGVLTFEGAVPPDQLEAFRRQWHQQVSGTQNAWKTPILSLGQNTKLNWQSLHSNNREMEWGKYMEYLIKTICGVFQIDPLEIGFDISKNPSGAGAGLGLGAGFATERLQYSQDKGLAPLLRFIANILNEYIVWRIDPDFEFEFVGLDSRSETEDMAIEEKQVKTYKMIDELRAEHDMPQMPSFEEIKGPGQLILDPTFLQAMQAAQQAKQAEQQQAMGGGQPGQDPSQPQAPGAAEPSYENMPTEDLHKELAKLKGGKPDQGQPSDGQGQPEARQGATGKGNESEQQRGKSSKDMAKSLEILI